MKRFFWILIFLISTPDLIAQNHQDYYTMGVSSFTKGDFRAADSLFSLSIKISPDKDAVYNRGMASKMMMDTCGYCADMYWARVFMSDKGAVENFRRDCIIKADTIFLSGSYMPIDRRNNPRYYDVFFHAICTSPVGQIFDVKNTYDYFGNTRPRAKDRSIFNAGFMKANILSEYYVQDSIRIYTAFKNKRSPSFKGADEELVMNQLRQAVVNNQPVLKGLPDKCIPLQIVVGPAGEIRSISCPFSKPIDEKQFAKVIPALRLLLISNFTYETGKVLKKDVLVAYNLYI